MITVNMATMIPAIPAPITNIAVLINPIKIVLHIISIFWLYIHE